MLQSVFERSMMVLRAWQDVSAVQHWKMQIFQAWRRVCEFYDLPFLEDDVSSSEVVVERRHALKHSHLALPVLRSDSNGRARHGGPFLDGRG